MAELSKLMEYNCNYKSEMTGTTWEGKFTFKKLSIIDKTKVSVRKLQLNGGYHFIEGADTGLGIDQMTDWTNTVIATLEVCLVQKPQWFNLNEIDDLELLAHLMEKHVDFESKFFRPLGSSAASRNESAQSSTENSNTQPAEAFVGSAVKKVLPE